MVDSSIFVITLVPAHFAHGCLFKRPVPLHNLHVLVKNAPELKLVSAPAPLHVGQVEVE